MTVSTVNTHSQRSIDFCGVITLDIYRTWRYATIYKSVFIWQQADERKLVSQLQSGMLYEDDTVKRDDDPNIQKIKFV